MNTYLQSLRDGFIDAMKIGAILVIVFAWAVIGIFLFLGFAAAKSP